MTKPTPRTFEQERAEAEAAASKATRELAQLKDEAKAVADLGPVFITALKAFEQAMRDAKVAPELRLVVAAALHSNVLRHLLTKCGVQEGDTEEAAQRHAALHSSVHELSVLGKRMEKRLIKESAVVGVGKMSLADDKSKGKG